MTTPRETELKYLLESEADHRALLAVPELVPRGAPIEQHNVYFDSEDRRLVARGALLRVRSSSAGPVLTFKEGRESPDIPGFFDAIEVECPLDPATSARILERPDVLHELDLPPAKTLRERVGAFPLHELATLHNERRVLVGRYTVEVDRMTFADGSNAWEVEVETSDPEGARDWLEDLTRRAGIRAAPRHVTKLGLVIERARD